MDFDGGHNLQPDLVEPANPRAGRTDPTFGCCSGFAERFRWRVVGHSVNGVKVTQPLLTATVTLVAAAGALSACGAVASSNPQSPSSLVNSEANSETGLCGTHEINKTSVRTFCGPGAITVKSGATTIQLSGAVCVGDERGFSLNAGTVVLDDDSDLNTTTQYVGIVAPGKSWLRDESRGRVSLTINDNGLAIATKPQSTKLVLTAGGSKGTITGPLQNGGGMASATFDCG